MPDSIGLLFTPKYIFNGLYFESFYVKMLLYGTTFHRIVIGNSQSVG